MRRMLSVENEINEWMTKLEFLYNLNRKCTSQSMTIYQCVIDSVFFLFLFLGNDQNGEPPFQYFLQLPLFVKKKKSETKPQQLNDRNRSLWFRCNVFFNIRYTQTTIILFQFNLLTLFNGVCLTLLSECVQQTCLALEINKHSKDKSHLQDKNCITLHQC